LLEKIATECLALNGKVFNILGEAFEEKSLKELLIEAIRYGDRPEVRARLTKRIDHAFDHENLKELLSRNALAQAGAADQKKTPAPPRRSRRQ
jgi:hypothetical protein